MFGYDTLLKILTESIHKMYVQVLNFIKSVVIAENDLLSLDFNPIRHVVLVFGVTK